MKKHVKITIFERSVFARCEVAEVEFSDRNSFQICDFQTLSGKHSTYLSLHSLVDNDVKGSGSVFAPAKTSDLGRRCFFSDVRKKDTASQCFEDSFGGCP